ncbi:MAG: TerC family protein [Armatimonadota bacterium]|jgi:tellurite resistance protein TerC|nr:TerC family protein [Armatimonadota bacterium]MDT7973062.1 TerC family protein [Armatimonadota bacterium]
MTEAPLWAWFAFLAVVGLMLAIDLGIFHRHAHIVSLREAAIWSVVWVVVALLFNLVILFWMGKREALEFLTGYLVEKALSADNIFVFAVLFNYFAVPPAYRHRVLFWGVLGAIVMRFAFIMAGAALLKKFHWVVYIFGIIVILSGIKLLRRRDGQVDPEKNPVIQLARRFLPLTPHYVGQQFVVRDDGRFVFTPLALVLLAVETTDVVFAVDSVPAIFAITRDPFIVFTSNICAILGLRALYFVLEGVMKLFRYLDEGLAIILVFIGIKMLLSEVYPIPVGLSLGFVLLVLTITIVLSLWAERRERAAALANPNHPPTDAEL